MRASVQNVSQFVLLIEEHPVRNRLYGEYIRKLGHKLILAGVPLPIISQAYAVAVISIPDEAASHAKYKELLDALPPTVSCIALSAGPLPHLFAGCTQLVRHIDRSDTHPGRLIDTVAVLTRG